MTTHQMSGSPEYAAWCAAKARCNNPNNPEYPRYGGRGIRMHPAWESSFEEFFAYMGYRPTDDHSIDRIDADGDYGPGNCRWATEIEQQRNRRSNRRYAFRGESLTVGEIAERTGVDAELIRARIEVHGYGVERAATQAPAELVEYQGVWKTLPEWADHIGVNYRTLYARVRVRGLSIHDAMTKPFRRSPAKR